MPIPIRTDVNTMPEVRQAIQRLRQALKTGPLNNLSATDRPNGTVDGNYINDSTEDERAGYSVFSFWVDVENDNAYMCVDSTPQHAIWLDLGGSGVIGAVTAYNTITGTSGSATASFTSKTLSVVGDGGAGGPITTVAANGSPDTLTLSLIPSAIDHDTLGNLGTDNHHAQVHAFGGSDHSGLSVVTPLDDHVLQYDTGVWVNRQLAHSTLSLDDGANPHGTTSRDVNADRIGASTYSTVQHMQDIFHSSGYVSGGSITAGVGATVDVAAGTGLIRASDSPTASIYFFDWSASTGVSVPSGETRYIGVEYNGGSPQVVANASYGSFDFNTDFVLGTAVNDGGTIHILNNPHAVGDHASKMIQRLYDTMPLVRDERTGGLILGETGTRNVTVSAGNLWDKLAKFAVSAIDTSGTDRFDFYWRNSPSGWNELYSQSAWPNTQYDNGSGTLATMTNNNYASLWFYLEPDGGLVMLYGQSQSAVYSTILDESPPSTVPDRITAHGRLIGRIIFKKSDATATTIQSVFTTQLSSAGVVDHGALNGLADDDHTQYALLAGRSGGQTIVGGTAAGNSLTLESTSNGTKGEVAIASGSDFNLNANDMLGCLGFKGVPPSGNAGYVVALGDQGDGSGTCDYLSILNASPGIEPVWLIATGGSTNIDLRVAAKGPTGKLYLDGSVADCTHCTGGITNLNFLNGLDWPVPAAGDDGKVLAYDHGTTAWVMATGGTGGGLSNAYDEIVPDTGDTLGASGGDTVAIAGGTAIATVGASGTPDTLTVNLDISGLSEELAPAPTYDFLLMHDGSTHKLVDVGNVAALANQISGTKVADIVRWMPPASSAAHMRMIAGGSTPAERYPAWSFDESTNEYIDLLVRFHDTYDGSSPIYVNLEFSASATSGNAGWGIAFRRLNIDAEDLDTAHTYSYQTSATGVASAIAELQQHVEDFTNAQADGVQGGELAVLRIYRDAGVTGDASGDIYLHCVSVTLQ